MLSLKFFGKVAEKARVPAALILTNAFFNVMGKDYSTIDDVNKNTENSMNHRKDETKDSLYNYYNVR